MLDKLLQGLNGHQDSTKIKDRAAKMLAISPEALEAFEQSYKQNILDTNYDTGNLLDISRAAVKSDMPEIKPSAASDELTRRIVAELLKQTVYTAWDGNGIESGLCLAPDTKDQTITPIPVTREDINALPELFRPQLTGNLAKKDIDGPSYPALLEMLHRSKTALTGKARQEAYHMFRQGLDILDVDPVTYQIIKLNRNSIGHWFDPLCHAALRQDFFKIPKTRIIQVPISLLQLTRLDYQSLTPATLHVVNEFCMSAFNLDDTQDYFVKTGVYSSKFDFRNAHVTGAKEVHELGEYLLFIHNQAVLMAGPLATPSIYGAATTTEWVVREFIPDIENNTTIYKGLPLRTEYRIFADMDTQSVIGMNPYWDPAVMTQRFGHEPDANSPHQIHDYITYKANEPRLMQRYEANKDRVKAHIASMLKNMNAAGLTGQWSIDIMQNGDDFYIIDMATAETSAFYDCVPKELRRPQAENWIPSLPEN